MQYFLRSVRLGIFLAYKTVRRGSRWQTILVSIVMMLTFLNLVVVTGILVGLTEGSVQAYSAQYAGDILVTRLPEKSKIERSVFVQSVIENLPEVATFSSRYSVNAEIEAHFAKSINTPNILPDTVGGQLVGIDPVVESALTGIETFMIEGEFITHGDDDRIVIGADRIARYFPTDFGLDTLDDVFIGDEVRVRIGDIEKDFIVKGILKSKAGPVDSRAYILDTELRKLVGRTNYDVDEIAIRLIPGSDPAQVKNVLQLAGVTQYAQVRTAQEAIGSFLEDIRKTFSVLGNVVGVIGLAVASVTIFIVIFISAITRQKYIGILKAIGITGTTIEVSYMVLSLFYAFIGTVLGVLILYGVLVPYFSANPIDFPFSDGILAVTTAGTIARVVLVFIATLIAGYIPARMIVKKNTLLAILGR